MSSPESNNLIEKASLLRHTSHTVEETTFSESPQSHPELVPLPLLVDVISFDHTTVDALLNLLRSMGCNVRQSHFNPTDLGSLSDARTSEFVCFAGDAESILNNRILERYRTVCPRATLTVGSSTLNLKLASKLIQHGAKAFFEIPASQDQIREEIGWLISFVSEQRANIRQEITHFQNYCTLTNSEIEVLRKMLEGCANKQIAQSLSIGLRTVELRRSKIMRKMQAKTISQLVYYVHKSGVCV